MKGGFLCLAVMLVVASVASAGEFRVDFARVDNTPPFGVFMSGYHKTWYVKGVRLRTLVSTGFLKLTVEDGKILETVMPPTPVKRDRSGDPSRRPH